MPDDCAALRTNEPAGIAKLGEAAPDLEHRPAVRPLSHAIGRAANLKERVIDPTPPLSTLSAQQRRDASLGRRHLRQFHRTEHPRPVAVWKHGKMMVPP